MSEKLTLTLHKFEVMNVSIAELFFEENKCYILI